MKTFNLFILFLLFPVSTFAQNPDEIILKQSLLFRNAFTIKDYGVKGKVKKLKITTSYSDTKIATTHETLFFSDTGMLTKKEFYREGERNATEILYFHYSNNKLDSITNTSDTAREVFNYDQQNRLIKKNSCGKYEENKDEIDEVEHLYYNSQNYIVKSVKEFSNLITECKYNSRNRIIQTKLYYSNHPKDADVTEYQFQTSSDKPDTIITKKNEKIQNTIIYKWDTNENYVETKIIDPDKTGRTVTNRIIYDAQGNVICNITFNNNTKTSEIIQEIQYQ